VEQRYVGIDLHRRRSVIYTMDAEGEKLSCVRIANEPSALMAAVAPAGDGAHVVIEATYGWYWAVDLLRDNGFDVHLAHPSGNDWGKRRVKNDERDARDLADLLRLGRLAEAWIAPPTVRELRELVRYRAKLVNLRSGLKTQVHAVMAKEGVLPSVLDMFGPGGAGSSTRCSWPSPTRCASSPCATWCPSMTERSSCSSARSSHPDPQRSGPHHRRHLLCRDRRCLPLPLRARVVLWAGLAPRHRESDTKVVRGSITKMGSRLVRWAALEAVARYHAARGCTRTSVASRSAEERRRRAWRWRTRCSRSSTAACATARSAVCATARQRECSDTARVRARRAA
jgi:transposase